MILIVVMNDHVYNTCMHYKAKHNHDNDKLQSPLFKFNS